MKVSVAWIGILLIVSVLVYFTVYGYHVWEQFQNPPTPFTPVQEEGFQDGSESGLNITMCPAGSKSYLDTNGRTVCCLGDVASDKCKGETICSLSEGMASLPSCTKWFETYLREKGRGRCPRSLPMYFESADGKVKGCTNGRLNKVGNAPALQNQKKCLLYSTKKEDNIDLNSCTNLKRLENAVCFTNSATPHEKALVNLYGGYMPAVVCSYKTEGLFPQTCYEKNTTAEFVDSVISNPDERIPFSLTQWKGFVNEASPQLKVMFCPIAEKVNITKTVQFDKLKNEKVYPEV